MYSEWRTLNLGAIYGIFRLQSNALNWSFLHWGKNKVIEKYSTAINKMSREFLSKKRHTNLFELPHLEIPILEI